MSTKKICVCQQDQTDCGAACLASISAHYGLEVPLARIRQDAGTDRNGTNALGMVEAANKLGFQAKAVRGTEEALQSVPLPAVAHVIREDLHHFVVLRSVGKQTIELMDPAEGQLIRQNRNDFLNEWSGVLILLLPGEHFIPGIHKTSAIRRFIQLLRPHRSQLLLALLGALIYSILGLATSVYVEKIVDVVLVDGDSAMLGLMTPVVLLMLLLRTLIGGFKNQLALRTGQLLDINLITGYYRHLFSLPQRFFDTMRTGEILSRVNDAVKIRQFLNNVSLDISVNILIVVCTLGLMFLYSWKLSLLVLGVIPAFIVLYRISNRLNKRYMRKLMEQAASLESQMVENVNNIGTIRRMVLENRFLLKTEKRLANLMNTAHSSGHSGIWLGSLSQLASGTLTILVLWLGCKLVFSQELTTGGLMSFFALTGYLLNPVQALIASNQSMQDALIAADRLFQIMDLEQECRNPSSIALKPGETGDIVFRNVQFGYGKRRPVLSGFNLVIPAGRITAVLGESGSGKSTLAALLQNIYPVQSGEIRIGELNLSQVQIISLRERIVSVPQDIQLFAGSILENIAPGSFEPDFRRIIQLCELLGIRDFIEELPENFHTILGENGVSLSGGEKQRLALARALYKDPDVLILDEATSSLDAYAEQKIRETIRYLRQQGKTIVLIAHRISVVPDADRIVFLKNGKVAEEGTHTELITRNGEYSRLLNTLNHSPNIFEYDHATN